MIYSISGYAGSGKDTVGKMIQYLTASDVSPKCLPLLKADVDITGYHNSTWEIKKWATALRKVAAILLGLPEEFLYTDEFKKSVLTDEWAVVRQVMECDENNNDGHMSSPLTGREFLQRLGTDAVRHGLHENAWVNALMGHYKRTGIMYNCPTGGQTVLSYNGPEWDGNNEDFFTYPNWIITDTRFPNELAAVKKHGGVSIRVERSDEKDCSFCGKTIREQKQGCTISSCYRQHLKSNKHESETALDNAEFDFIIDNNGTLDELKTQVERILNTQINNNGHQTSTNE